MGSIWEGSGEVLGGIWDLLGLLGLFWGFIFSCLYLEWSAKVLLEASWLDLGSIFQALEGIWDGFWEGFGRILVILGCSGLFLVIRTFVDDF